jgi:hypothetical protein
LGVVSNSREEIVEVFDALDADLDCLCGLSFDVFTTAEGLRALERLERVARRLRAPQHALIIQLAAQASEEELGAKLLRRWLTGCASPKPKPAGASPKPRTWGHVGR